MFTMKIYSTNCILTPNHGPQVFLDLEIPLEAGEDICRVLFVAVYTAFMHTQGNHDSRLVKVSMCASIPEGMTGEDMDANPALAWFKEGNGKIYFD